MIFYINKDVNNTIIDIGIPLNNSHIPLVDGIKIDIEKYPELKNIEMESLVYNYKLVNDHFIELTPDEKEVYLSSYTLKIDENKNIQDELSSIKEGLRLLLSEDQIKSLGL